MEKSSDVKNRKQVTRESIIGLGETSFRKSYYSELQVKLTDLERINARNRALIATIPDMLLVSTPEGNITTFTEETEDESLIEQAILKDKDIVAGLREMIRQVTESGKMAAYDFVFRYYDVLYYFEARINVSEIDEVLIIIRDMTERTLLERKLRDMAERDSLTKLYNRNYFTAILDEYDERIINKFAIIVIDIDGVKLINDTLGHFQGDFMIITVADILKRQFADTGVVARIGGDEFGIMLVGCSQEEIEKQLEQFKNKIAEYNETANTIKISTSSGYSYNESGTIKANFMMQEADNYMYQNKLLKEASLRNSLVKTLMKALEEKDFITEGHADRLEELSIKIGKALKLSQHKIDRIKLLAKFHDIGKVGIPDVILNKNAKLTDDEWKVMKTHSNIGKRIAESSSFLNEISELIFLHHEKWDGTGYPLGLKGDDIPIECRIISIVDAFDAMTNDRPYRKALPLGKAIKEICDCAGTQFDNDLVKIFLKSVI